MHEVIRKVSLDGRVAVLFGKRTPDISRITTAFLREVRRALAEEGCVRLDGLGEIRVVRRRGVRARIFQGRPVKHTQEPIVVNAKYYVTFRKAVPLTLAIREQHGRASTPVKKTEKKR